MSKTKTTSKRNLKLSSLQNQQGKNYCASVASSVNKHTTKAASKKVNVLRPCLDKCEKENKDLPIITSPFEAYKLNTANNGLSSKLTGGVDPTWESAEGPATSDISGITAWQQCYVRTNSAWTPSPFGNANWISIYDDAKHSGNKNIYFRKKFILGENINPATFFLDMDFYADNSVQEIFVNGQAQSVYAGSNLPQSTNPYHHRGFDSGKQVSIRLEKDWKGCENEIVVHVKSGPSYVGFLAQNSSGCLEAEIPELSPIIELIWGDSDCDCIETDDYELFYLSVRNPYNNVSFSNFRIGAIQVVDAAGNPVSVLPDGTDSVELTPIGPYCFGDVGPCNEKHNNVIYREFVLNNRGAKAGEYKIILDGICFDVSNAYSESQCYRINLCAS